jgi:plastocyanin
VKRFVLGLGLVAMTALTAACSSGGGGAAPTGGSATVTDGSVTVVAKDLAFLTTSISAPAGEAFEIILDNQENVPHNISVSDAAGTKLVTGDIVTMAKATNAVPALTAGAYPFICDVHPDMKGTITAE